METFFSLKMMGKGGILQQNNTHLKTILYSLGAPPVKNGGQAVRY